MRHSLTAIYACILFSCLLAVSYCLPVFPDEIPIPIKPTDNNDTAQGEIYIDQVIDETTLEEAYKIEDQGRAVLMPDWAPGTLGVTYRFFRDTYDGYDYGTEHGLALHWRQDTAENGSFEVQAEALVSDEDEEDDAEFGRFLLLQQDYMLNNNMEMDSELGHFRSTTPQLISRSYRFYLPSTLVQGVGTQVRHGDTTVSLTTGKIGNFTGMAAQAFETTQGSLHGMGLTHTPNDQWAVASQIWTTHNPEQGDSHQSVATAIQYQDKKGTQSLQVHTLIDNSGHVGAWVDNQFPVQRWQIYTGIFILEPGLDWTDTQIDNDREGMYWRGERSGFRWQWALGSEISRNNIYEDSGKGGYIRTSSFVNGTYRYRRKTSFGGSVDVDTRPASSGIEETDDQEYKLKAWGRHETSLGTTRIQPSLDRYETETDPYTEYGLLWDQDWRAPFFSHLHSYVQYYQTDRGDHEYNLRLMLRKSFPWDLSLSATGQYLHNDNHGYGVTRGRSLTMDASWQMHPNWLMTLSGDYNVNMFEPDDTEYDDYDETTDGYRIALALSYAIGIGHEPLLYGQRTGNKGHGRIGGRVFFDKNENGTYDLNEEGAANIVVYLDGRYRIQTNPQGRFEYWPVATGEHMLQIGIEDVPLPWGQTDTAPQKVFVSVRDTAEMDFPLIRINK